MSNLWIIYPCDPLWDILFGGSRYLFCACNITLMSLKYRSIILPVGLLYIWNGWHIPWDFYFWNVCHLKPLIFSCDGLLDVSLLKSLGLSRDFCINDVLLVPKVISDPHPINLAYLRLCWFYRGTLWFLTMDYFIVWKFF